MKQKKAAGIFLIILATVLGFFTIVDFDWKPIGLTTVFLIGYLLSGTSGVFYLLEGTRNLPDYFYSSEE